MHSVCGEQFFVANNGEGDEFESIPSSGPQGILTGPNLHMHN